MKSFLLKVFDLFITLSAGIFLAILLNLLVSDHLTDLFHYLGFYRLMTAFESFSFICFFSFFIIFIFKKMLFKSKFNYRISNYIFWFIVIIRTY